MKTTSYSFEVTLSGALPEAKAATIDALKQEEFGIISEIDIAAKFKEKLGVVHPPHIILGACNPGLAYQAIEDNTDVALALPCNVVLKEHTGKTTVSAMLPSVALTPFTGINVQKSSCTAEEALSRVFDFLSQLSQ